MRVWTPFFPSRAWPTAAAVRRVTLLARRCCHHVFRIVTGIRSRDATEETSEGRFEGPFRFLMLAQVRVAADHHGFPVPARCVQVSAPVAWGLCTCARRRRRQLRQPESEESTRGWFPMMHPRLCFASVFSSRAWRGGATARVVA